MFTVYGLSATNKNTRNPIDLSNIGTDACLTNIYGYPVLQGHAYIDLSDAFFDIEYENYAYSNKKYQLSTCHIIRDNTHFPTSSTVVIDGKTIPVITGSDLSLVYSGGQTSIPQFKIDDATKLSNASDVSIILPFGSNANWPELAYISDNNRCFDLSLLDSLSLTYQLRNNNNKIDNLNGRQISNINDDYITILSSMYGEWDEQKFNYVRQILNISCLSSYTYDDTTYEKSTISIDHVYLSNDCFGIKFNVQKQIVNASNLSLDSGKLKSSRLIDSDEITSLTGISLCTDDSKTDIPVDKYSDDHDQYVWPSNYFALTTDYQASSKNKTIQYELSTNDEYFEQYDRLTIKKEFQTIFLSNDCMRCSISSDDYKDRIKLLSSDCSVDYILLDSNTYNNYIRNAQSDGITNNVLKVFRYIDTDFSTDSSSNLILTSNFYSIANNSIKSIDVENSICISSCTSCYYVDAQIVGNNSIYSGTRRLYMYVYDPLSSIIYTGKAISAHNIQLSLSDDSTIDTSCYIVQYENNTEPGVATMKISGIRNTGWTGTLSRNFYILSTNVLSDSSIENS